ncbi:MAG: hypothetical protein AUJ71_04795 [Candidatus Omnitrophica bacterium CG1_02_49_16]|nr:MAG: hypothetical protein AUJ71_04795 [Candidatus Omnitrophica bacterium CG1_02_49_16]
MTDEKKNFWKTRFGSILMVLLQIYGFYCMVKGLTSGKSSEVIFWILFIVIGFLIALYAIKKSDNGKQTPQSSLNFDPNEFHAQGTYIWSKTYPVLLLSFYGVLLVGWIFLSPKSWGLSLAIIYLLVGLFNFNFITVPSSAVRSNRFPSIGELLYSVLISPRFLLFFPLKHFFTMIWLTFTVMRSSKKK